MKEERLLGEALRAPTTAITYELNRALREGAHGRAVLETSSGFDPLGFARAGHAEATLAAGPMNEILTRWIGREEGVVDSPDNAWLDLTWRGQHFELVRVSFQAGYECKMRWWLIGDDEKATRDLLEAVAAWSADVHGEILVFQDGAFEKSARLHREIQRASWDDLVLRGATKEDILGDFERFFASEATYEELGAPWRRGALFLGPPGNGKTHCVKALVHRLQRPTIYVRGFRHRYRTTVDCISEVFTRARQIAPCAMVLEDLEGLFDPEGLAFFLNEVDGFADNRGVVILGTTNHPERLDPALLDRPSRFDRTYAFELPNDEDRRNYLRHQRPRLAAAGDLSDAAIDEVVGATREFSFAYLKELVVGSLLAVAGGSAPNAEAAARARSSRSSASSSAGRESSRRRRRTRHRRLSRHPWTSSAAAVVGVGAPCETQRMEMTGRIAVVTGANSGIGKVTARELARKGATVIMTARDEARGKAALDDVRRASGSDSVELMLCDFSSQRAIRAFGKAFREKYDALHVLVNNAGALVPERKITEDGLELTFAANHLGYFLTTELLLDRLKAAAPARIVSVASAGHTRAKSIPWDDLNSERGYSGVDAYCVSKLANILFTFELARRLEGTGVTANCLHPGAVATNFGLGGGWLKWAVKLAQPFMIDDEKGAETQIFLASSPEVEGVSGKYFAKKKPIEASRAAKDMLAAKRLWALSEDLVRKSAELAKSA